MKTIFKGKWIEVVEQDGYEMMKERPSVHILPYYVEDNKTYYGIRLEDCPAYRDKPKQFQRFYTIVSGGMEEGESIEDTARREANEEAGVKIIKSMTSLYSQEILPISKSSTKRAGGILMEVEKDFEYPVGDGTQAEKNSETLWLTYEDILNVVETKPHDLMLELFYRIIQSREGEKSQVTEQILESLRLLRENQTMNIEEAVDHATKVFQRELTEAAKEIQGLSEQLEKLTEDTGTKYDSLIAENQALEVESQKAKAQLRVYEATGSRVHLRSYQTALLECQTVEEVDNFVSKIKPARGPVYNFDERLIEGKARGSADITFLQPDKVLTEAQVAQRSIAGIKTKEKKK